MPFHVIAICGIYFIPHAHLHIHTCTHAPQLADGVWLVEGYEARLVAFVGTNITRGDGTERCGGNKRSYGRGSKGVREGGGESEGVIHQSQEEAITRHMSKNYGCSHDTLRTEGP